MNLCSSGANHAEGLPRARDGHLPQPGLAVVLVSYRSRGDLENCLSALHSQDRQPDEILIVDNGAEDGLGPWIRREYPHIRLLTAGRNLGYAGGNNHGVRAARHEYVLLLNPDTVLHQGTLDRLFTSARANPRAIVTAKLLNLDGSINACGLNLHITGIATCRAYRTPCESMRGVEPVAIASGAALIARKELLEDVGLFDESYFMYMEDVDLSIRARLAGYDILCHADAPVTHSYELAMTPLKFRLLERNRLTTLFKNFRVNTLLRLLAPLCMTELAVGAYAVSRGPAYIRAFLRSRLDVVVESPRWLAARKLANQRRRRSDEQVLAWTGYGLHLSQLVVNPHAARMVLRATSIAYRALAPGVRALS